MTWTVSSIERERDTITAIDRHDDRSAAILAGAYLEARLTSAIEAHLVADKKVINKFFAGIGPLATFSAKIDLAYLIDLYPKEITEKLHVIRKIRNYFAHRLDALMFNSPLIRDLCKRLIHVNSFASFRVTSTEELEDTPGLQEMQGIIRQFAGVSDTPRSRYMNTIKFLLFFLELKKVSKTMKEHDYLEIIRGKTAMRST
jgi:hypothetical protein